MCVRSIGLAEEGPPDVVRRGVDALYAGLGPDAGVLLAPMKPRNGESASFEMRLPEDYLGHRRTISIGFPTKFPREGLRIRIDPSPWLQWPHVMKNGVCLFGLRERPVSGTPEQIVAETLRRIRRLLGWIVAGSDPAARQTEFDREITAYWSEQLPLAIQQVVLLDRPEKAGALFVLTDMRPRRDGLPQMVWLAEDPERLTRHWERISGQRTRMRAPASPAFFVPLTTLPGLEMPAAGQWLDWVEPHVRPDHRDALRAWEQTSGPEPVRWLIVQLPDTDPPRLFAVALRGRGTRRDGRKTYGRRAARRSRAEAFAATPAVMAFTPVHVLDRRTVHSRDLTTATTRLADAHVVLVGVGTLGGALATHLARVGVGRLTLIDPDVLADANLGRHVLGSDDLGRFKAQALREKLRRDMPSLDVKAICEYIQVALAAQPDLLDSATLVAVTTADWPSEIAVWEAKVAGALWTAVQAWSEPYALIGHALVAPASAFDARSLFEANGKFHHRYSIWPDDGVKPLPGCGASYIPGGPVALAPITAMVAGAVVQALTQTLAAPVWLTSLADPAAITKAGGYYRGPPLQGGVSTCVLTRPWPPAEEWQP